MNVGPAEIGLVLLAVMLLFGYRRLPDASLSLGRSLRIFKGEVNAAREEAPSSAPGGAEEREVTSDLPSSRPAPARAGDAGTGSSTAG
jgi:sec-independent protein translocase protein TatA